MKLLAALFLVVALVVPVEAQTPTVEQALEAYASAGWVKRDGLVCISPEGSDYVDAIVSWLAKKARGLAI